MYKQKVFINCSDADCLSKLKISSFFKMFQDAAVFDCESLHIGKSYGQEHNLMWVVSRAYVEFDRLPDYQETVEIMTYPHKTMRIIYPRYAKIIDKNGKAIIKLVSIWALIDAKTRNIADVSLDIPYQKFDDDLPLPKKINIDAPLTFKESNIIKYTDCDVNGHMNNTCYIEYILNVFDSDFYKKHQIQSLHIEYMHEVKEKEKLDLYINSLDTTSYIVGKVDDKVVFASQLNYKEI